MRMTILLVGVMFGLVGTEGRGAGSGDRGEEIRESVGRLRESREEQTRKAAETIEARFEALEVQLNRLEVPDREDRLERFRAARSLFVEQGVVPSYLGREATAYHKAMAEAIEAFAKAADRAKAELVALGDRDAAEELEREIQEGRETLRRIAAGLSFNQEGERAILSTVESGRGARWRWTINPPPPGWHLPGFNASGWAQGVAPFGNGGRELRINTKWETEQIWLRTQVEVPPLLPDDMVVLRHRHDDEFTMYSDQGPMLTFRWWNNAYQNYVLTEPEKAKLGTGPVTLAATCKQERGGQVIDLGLFVCRKEARDPRLDPVGRDEARWLAARQRTDRDLVMRSDRGGLQSNLKAFKDEIDPWAELKVEGQLPYLDRGFGRRRLIVSHPLGREQAATLDFSKLTRGGAGRVRLWVHGYPGRPDGGEIHIKVGSRTFHQQPVYARDGWVLIDIPYRGQDVVVEHSAVGWNMEYLFFDYMIQPIGQ